MKKNKIIIVEGPQGTGKTTLTNYLRDNLPGSNLYRLSGQKDKTPIGKKLSRTMYQALLDYLKKMETIPMDLIFDRTFFTEEIYARLGYKEYTFNDVYESLIEQLVALNYDIYLIILYLENTENYQIRLAREHHHNYQAFSVTNSVNQQNAYLKMQDELKNLKNLQVISIAMDDFQKSYQTINEIFQIKNQTNELVEGKNEYHRI